ncbi:hypothetical protein PR048_008637 [Dryococelus australis]|uniref:Uncharacterized protein n=1 Tax=Dryococelus australis TaxID=614101 RepID=A0ABQ9HXP5_9NEOP|nr:hypothetical protein PR048_008637 [Dryococelus australis]
MRTPRRPEACQNDLTNQPSCSGMHWHRIKISSLLQFATSSSTTVSNNQSSVPYSDRTFDGILLETLLQHSKPNLKKKTRILGGAEVITKKEEIKCHKKEAIQLKKEAGKQKRMKIQENNCVRKGAEGKKYLLKAISDEEQFGLETLKKNLEAETDAEYFQPQQTIQIGRWVLGNSQLRNEHYITLCAFQWLREHHSIGHKKLIDILCHLMM